MNVNEASNEELLQAHELIWNCSLNFIKPMSLKCAIELGIPDIINNNQDQTITLTNLISKLPIHPSKSHCIRRLMRILVHFGFFTSTQPREDEEEKYSLTLISRLLLKDSPIRATPIVLSQLNPLLVTPWHSFSKWLRSDTESTTFEMVHGTNVWEMFARDPELNKDFAGSMEVDSNLTAKIVLDLYQDVFEGLESLVDVGGGTGIMARSIAEAFPGIQCTVLDLPYNVANAQGMTNLNFVGGDMFEAIPQANAVLLKWILHDWSDEEALIILKRCREAIDWSKDKGGKIMIIDMVIDQSQTLNEMDKKSTETQLCFDMVMMVNATGKERNKKEWESLFFAAGFSRYKISPIVELKSLIEVYP